MNKLTVTLTHEDIADIANDMNEAFPMYEKPSQGYLEFLMCAAIREKKNVDFFKEEAREIKELEKVETEEQKPFTVGDLTPEPMTLGDLLREQIKP